VITVENLSKRYRIGQREPYNTVREAVSNASSKSFRLLRSLLSRERTPIHEHGIGSKGSNDYIWALKDVSFEISRGEVVGVIGHNGAGKSTLLKILSRITEPTGGAVDLYGRVGSLLEVGTGFHPELTGRENIYLSGAVLGMKKEEIQRKFDEIVSFAEIEKFVGTPVKRYSSGMYLRLAFAVAAHLETEILLVDEVLAVGDAQFQKKCFEKMRAVGREGRTILFVSHNMAAVRHICSRALALEHGALVDHGAVNDVVDRYLAKVEIGDRFPTQVETSRYFVDDIHISSSEGSVIKTFDPVEVVVTVRAKSDVRAPGLYVAFLTVENQRLAGLDLRDLRDVPQIRSGQKAELGFKIDAFPLLPGRYLLELYLKDMADHSIEHVPRTFHFDVVETPVYGARRLDRWYGLVALSAQGIVQTSCAPVSAKN
jgi:lipopolysaccharide transport system ATP-binding protein